MPELPEVETIRLQLEKYLVGHSIQDIEIFDTKIFSGNKKDVIGAKVKEIKRFAKALSIDLSNGFSIVVHVKLTGQLIYRGPNLPKTKSLSTKVVGGLGGKHTHVIFKLDRGGFLYYNDVRRFGWIKVAKSDKVQEISFIAKLGPEPFDSAQGKPSGKFQGKPSLLTLDLFKQIIVKSGRPIKIVLMDQAKIGGVGNIYANDALWLAKVNPRTPANQLVSKSVSQLFRAILNVLKTGLKYGGASELAFVTPEGSEGEYQKHTLAYGREGEPCSRCKKAKFEKFFLGGRGTYFCPVCQKLTL